MPRWKNSIVSADGRVCRSCEVWKPWSEFYKQPKGSCGREARCKACVSVKTHLRNSTPERKIKISEYGKIKERDPAIKAKRAAQARERQRRPEIRERNNRLRRTDERRNKRNAARRFRLKYDADYALIERARSMIHRCLRAAGLRKNLPTFEILGYGPDKLRDRIECQFKPGMSWDNHSDWHIDHKKPISAFIAQGIKDAKTINSLCNLQPMWASENISKNNKWPLAANDNNPEKAAA